MPALSNIIRLVLIALLVVTPWFFGGVLATTQWGLMLVVAVLLALDVASLVRAVRRFHQWQHDFLCQPAAAGSSQHPR